jgi:NAD(P)-dependent dehydrogenase (short-subunit alcohol dehydrogenase family)
MTVTLITGTNSGIGLATVIRLAGAGHQVYAGVRNPDNAQNLAAAIAQGDGRISMLELDVTNETTIVDAVAQMLSIEGQVDVLINNAGISRGSSVEETPQSAVKELFETNFFGTVRLTQELIPGMRERKNGTIINMSSIDGRLATPNNAFYAASKFAVEAFSESLAAQLLPFNIRVAVIEPGFIATTIFENTAKAEEAHNPKSPYFVYTRRFMKLLAAQLGIDTPPRRMMRPGSSNIPFRRSHRNFVTCWARIPNYWHRRVSVSRTKNGSSSKPSTMTRCSTRHRQYGWAWTYTGLDAFPHLTPARRRRRPPCSGVPALRWDS